MNFLFPDHRALCMAENATHNLHNVLTLRGALVRDPRVWSSYLDEAHRAVRGRRRRPLRAASLAALGTRAHRRLPRQAARPLRLHPRPGAAAAEQGARRQRDRRGLRAAAEPGARVALPRLLRLAQPQRQGRLPALPRLVRRQPGAPVAAPARGRGDALRRAGGRRRRAARPRPRGVRRGRLPLGRRGRQPPRLRRPRQRRRRASSRRRRWSSSAFGAENGTWRNFFLMGALELREGVAGTAAVDGAAGHRPQPVRRAALRRAGDPHRRAARRRPAHRAALALHRHRRGPSAHPRARRPHAARAARPRARSTRP